MGLLGYDHSQCNSHGICKNDHCYCDLYWKGAACEQRVDEMNCYKNCNGNGLCVEGKC